MARAFDAYVPRGLNLGADVYPTYPGMVIRQHDGQRVAQQMTWGFPLRLKSMKPTSKPKPVNNARDDKLMTPFWKRWFTDTEYRCLIPFTEFAEAEGPKGKMTRTWISVRDQPLAAWAGLWRPSDEWGDVYTGLMVDATKELWDKPPAPQATTAKSCAPSNAASYQPCITSTSHQRGSTSPVKVSSTILPSSMIKRPPSSSLARSTVRASTS